MRRPVGILVFVALLALVAGASRDAADASGPLAYHPSIVLVAFDDQTTAAERASVHADAGGTVVNRFAWLNLDVVRIPDGASPPEVAASYERLDAVAYASPNWIYRVDSIPNDTRFSDLWGLHNTGQTGGTPDADIDAPEGWTLAFGEGNFESSGGARVGVLDTGIDKSHVDLLGKTKACARATTGTGEITEGECDDDNSHGTHVSGTIAALTNNSTGVAGVAPNAELTEFKAFNSGGGGYFADVIAGLHWTHTVGQATIINNSWGGPDDPGLRAEVAEADAAGVLLIASVGSSGCECFAYPAAYPEVVAVTATDDDDVKASFANFNSDLEVAGPGVSILSTVVGGGYSYYSGTSMATSSASGVAAMIQWKYGTDNDATRAILTSSADDLGDPGRDKFYGFGRLNLAKALSAGGIAGKVRRRNGNPIPAATVNCPGAGSDTTAADGSYEILNVAPGNYSCTASAAGFRSKTKPVTVNAGQTSTLNFRLRRA